jgi:hypothetical protein
MRVAIAGDLEGVPSNVAKVIPKDMKPMTCDARASVILADGSPLEPIRGMERVSAALQQSMVGQDAARTWSCQRNASRRHHLTRQNILSAEYNG